MAIKDKYYIQEIDYHTAENIVVKCHYAHRKASCMRAFGLFTKNPSRIVGVVMYGIPVSKELCANMCGIEEKNNIYELTRLYVDDGLEKNLESYLVGNTLKMLDKEIIVSYSDLGYGHVGVIYQATNFLFTGTTKENNDYVEIDENGNKLHSKAVTERYGGVENIQKAMANGRNIFIEKRSKKNRYVYFNANKKRKKELLAKLTYPILPYPKATSPVPITSTENINDNKRKTLF